MTQHENNDKHEKKISLTARGTHKFPQEERMNSQNERTLPQEEQNMEVFNLNAKYHPVCRCFGSVGSVDGTLVVLVISFAKWGAHGLVIFWHDLTPAARLARRSAVMGW